MQGHLMSKKATMIVGTQSGPVREITGFLQHHGYVVWAADRFSDALAEIPVARPQIIMLFMDWRPFPAEAWQICQLGKRMTDAGVIVITFSQGVEDRVMALKGGADTCLAWPVDLDELLARIEALLRRQKAGIAVATSTFVRPDLCVDLDTREVWVKGERKNLTVKEFDLLAALIDCSRRQAKDDGRVLHSVWPEAEGKRELLRQYIWRLRRKIEPDPTTPEYIVYEPGSGYRLAD